VVSLLGLVGYVSVGSYMLAQWMDPRVSEASLAQWAGYTGLLSVHGVGSGLAELGSGNRDTDKVLRVKMICGEYWMTCFAGNGSEVEASSEYVILEMKSSCCGRAIVDQNSLSLSLNS
jgi:hypothetical protein